MSSEPVAETAEAAAASTATGADAPKAPGAPAPAEEPGAAPAEPDAIPLCIPELRGREGEYLQECVDTNWVSSAGPFVERFEKEVAGYVGAEHAVAAASGTAALHLALLAAGVEPGDEVLVSTLTFIAPANAVRYCGAYPVFIDAEPEYGQMDPEQVAAFLQEKCERRDGACYNTRTGRRVKAVVPVHILGHPVDMDPLLEAARAAGLAVIEDATESLGTIYRGQSVGTLGDAAAFSFNGNKMITTGGGGMLVTGREDWAEEARYLSTQAKDDPKEYVHEEIGYNYRLTNVQAALGCAQMEHLDDYVEKKRAIAARYAEALGGVRGIEPMREAPWARSAFWLYTVRVSEDRYGMDRRALMHALEEERIQTRPLWQPMHRSPAHEGAEAQGGGVADGWRAEALSLPCSVGLTEAQQERVIEAVARHAGRQP